MCRALLHLRLLTKKCVFAWVISSLCHKRVLYSRIAPDCRRKYFQLYSKLSPNQLDQRNMVLRYFFEAIPVGFTALSFDIDVVSAYQWLEVWQHFQLSPRVKKNAPRLWLWSVVFLFGLVLHEFAIVPSSGSTNAFKNPKVHVSTDLYQIEFIVTATSQQQLFCDGRCPWTHWKAMAAGRRWRSCGFLYDPIYTISANTMGTHFCIDVSWLSSLRTQSHMVSSGVACFPLREVSCWNRTCCLCPNSRPAHDWTWLNPTFELLDLTCDRRWRWEHLRMGLGNW